MAITQPTPPDLWTRTRSDSFRESSDDAMDSKLRTDESARVSNLATIGILSAKERAGRGGWQDLRIKGLVDTLLDLLFVLLILLVILLPLVRSSFLIISPLILFFVVLPRV